MEDLGIDTEFIKPHHMDVDTLLAAAAKADDERRRKDIYAAMRDKVRRSEELDMASVIASGDKKTLSNHIKHHEFTSLPRELYDEKRVKKVAAGKDPDKPSKNELKKMDKEAKLKHE